jgi:ABC-type multidrug transport system permease subunit
MVFRALVWKELKSQKWMYLTINLVSIIIMMPFLVRISGWGSSLFLVIQVFSGYLFMRESFVGDKQMKTLESLFATPVDGQTLWLARVIFYGLAAVLFSLVIIFSAAVVLNSFQSVDFWCLLISPLTFIILGLAGIILWRVKQTYSDIIALVVMSIVAMVLIIIPVYIIIVPAVCILIASWRLASDKESIVMS